MKISQKISRPFSELNEHIKLISRRNFSDRLNKQEFNELDELIVNINDMTEKLNNYDKAQHTFFENISHEFRTPLMSIQSYAEGIKYEVVDNTSDAVDIILNEVSRLTNLVQDLLYISRLDSINEQYKHETINICELLQKCCESFKVMVPCLQ